MIKRKRKRVRNREMKKRDTIIEGRKTESLKVRDEKKREERERKGGRETEKCEKSRGAPLLEVSEGGGGSHKKKEERDL